MRADILEKVHITNTAAEGKSIARVNDLVIFIPYGAPGDIVDVQITTRKKSWAEGRIIRFHHFSPLRVNPRCKHFGSCGGCKWQHLHYEEQLRLKQQQVLDNFQRIGHLELPPYDPIIPSENQFFYRNKLEFTFSSRRWLSKDEIHSDSRNHTDGLGMHPPGMFDRIVDLEECFLQQEPSNSIRLAVRDYALRQQLEFYDVRQHRGFLRNLIIRTTTTGEIMIILVVGYENKPVIPPLVEHILQHFPEITSFYVVVNPKRNDSISDLKPELIHGKPHITEKLGHLHVIIGPLSFYQTNSHQTIRLYETVERFAGFHGNEVVYDLYCGTGTITNFIADRVQSAVGIELIPEAITDAVENSRFNHITNTRFVVGDIAKTLNDEFLMQFGKPHVIITDPPRSGMHPRVLQQLLKIEPEKIIYVSCNPATQARDIAVLTEKYSPVRMQAVDMFPQTHHVENVALLLRKS